MSGLVKTILHVKNVTLTPIIHNLRFTAAQVPHDVMQVSDPPPVLLTTDHDPHLGPVVAVTAGHLSADVTMLHPRLRVAPPPPLLQGAWRRMRGNAPDPVQTQPDPARGLGGGRDARDEPLRPGVTALYQQRMQPGAIHKMTGRSLKTLVTCLI